MLTQARCSCCRAQTTGLNRDELLKDAQRRFRERRATLGVPAAPKPVIHATGPNASLHDQADGLAQIRQYFFDYAIEPVEKLLLIADDILQMCSGRDKYHASFLEKLMTIPGYGNLNAGDISQDLLGNCGICEDTPGRVFGDLNIATYVGVGAEKGCNLVFRGDREAQPGGTASQRLAQWYVYRAIQNPQDLARTVKEHNRNITKSHSQTCRRSPGWAAPIFLIGRPQRLGTPSLVIPMQRYYTHI